MKALIQTPTPNLQASIDFYESIDFKVISRKGEKDPAFVTDGKALIEINPTRTARAGVKIYSKSLAPLTGNIGLFGKVLDIEGGKLISAPSGVWVYMMEAELPVDFTAEEKSFGLVGNYMGVSIETTDFENSAAFWQAMGFSIGMGTIEQGWVALFHESGFGVSLMKAGSCPHLFFNPSLTYFNSGGNPEIIAEIRKRNVPIAEEITVFNKEGIVDNVILRDPGGLGFFVFND